MQRALPRSTGFSALTGEYTLFAKRHYARVTISGIKSPRNLGPGFVKTFRVRWHRRDPAGMLSNKVQSLLEDVARFFVNGRLPKRGMFLEGCNTSGERAEVFLERVCTLCECPYCELSSTYPQ